MVASSWWELAASPADSRPELPNLRLVELAFVACAQAMRRACRPGLRGRRQRRESLGMAQKKAGQAHCRLVARARSSRACQAARTRKVRPSLYDRLSGNWRKRLKAVLGGHLHLGLATWHSWGQQLVTAVARRATTGGLVALVDPHPVRALLHPWAEREDQHAHADEPRPSH